MSFPERKRLNAVEHSLSKIWRRGFRPHPVSLSYMLLYTSIGFRAVAEGDGQYSVCVVNVCYHDVLVAPAGLGWEAFSLVCGNFACRLRDVDCL